jgi:hypothetical protein
MNNYYEKQVKFKVNMVILPSMPDASLTSSGTQFQEYASNWNSNY